MTSTQVPATLTRVAAGPALTSAGLVTVLLGAALPLIDFFIVNIALPAIGTDLRTSSATLELVIAAYGIAYAVLLVVGGRLGDAFGRRKLFLIGLAAFTVTSLLCGIAPTALTLVLARAAQGAAAALMLPQVLSIIQATTTGERRSKALGLYGATAGLSMVLGQFLGGALVAADLWGTGWRPIFLVNVPVGIAGLLIARRLIPESRSSDPIGIDRSGTVLLAIALVSLLLPLAEGPVLNWPLWTIVLLVVFPFAAAGFVHVERRMERQGGVPLLPPSVMRMPSVRQGLLVGMPFFVGFSAFMFVFAVTLQDGLHLGPFGSGLVTAPLSLAFFAMCLVSSRLVTRFGQRVVSVGLSIQLLGLLVLIGTVLLEWPDLGVLDFAPGMLLCGLGQGLAMTTVFRIVLSKVPPEIAGVGSGMLTTSQQAAMALGVATLGTLFAAVSAGSLGMKGAFTLVIGIQAALTIGVITVARRLPDPRV
ncbi:MFS transporter [Amycolatopsis sp. lyj-84]|uniref:MFS transporter n=1 Tax=Amycolatopsis sp. lyj-84 TaxID=2789284 RepID=UPI003978E3D9